MRNLHRHGTLSSYYPDGKLESQVDWRIGQVHGFHRRWHKNGQLNQEFPYHRGKLHGVVRIWFDDGNPCEETSYAKGQRDGECRTYWSRGRRQTRTTWTNGVPQGPFEAWDAKGNLLASGELRDGLKQGRWEYHEGLVVEYYRGRAVSALLPPEIIAGLAKTYPGFDLYRPEPESWVGLPWFETASPMEAGLIWGDFAAEGLRSYAVTLRSHRDPKTHILAVVLPGKVVRVLELADLGGRPGRIRLAKKGSLHPTARGSELALPTDAIAWSDGEERYRRYRLYLLEGQGFRVVEVDDPD